MQDKASSDDLLEQIKNLSLSYNQKVPPCHRISIQKPQNALEMLTNNQISCKIFLYSHIIFNIFSS